MPLRNPLELFGRNSGAKFLMSAPKPKQREVRFGSNSEVPGRGLLDQIADAASALNLWIRVDI